MKRIAILLLILSVLVFGCSQKSALVTTGTLDQATEDTSAAVDSTEDIGVNELDSIETDLNETDLDSLGSDLDNLEII